jgi:hypothetical protein
MAERKQQQQDSLELSRMHSTLAALNDKHHSPPYNSQLVTARKRARRCSLLKVPRQGLVVALELTSACTTARPLQESEGRFNGSKPNGFRTCHQVAATAASNLAARPAGEMAFSLRP